MKRRESRVLDTARNVQAFLTENADVIGPRIASCRRNLDDAIKQLTEMAVDQGAGQTAAKGATARQRSLRNTLRRHHMKPITLVAKQMLSKVPEFEALTMPTRKLGATRLVAAANAMAEGANRHSAVFTEVGLPDDFIVRLVAAASAVTTSLDDREKGSSRGKGATAGMRAQERRLRSVFQLIDALVGPALGTDEVLIAKWNATRAIRRKFTPAPATVAAPESASPTTSVNMAQSHAPVVSIVA